ncbi:GvpL/GvpF family gas vesicle protein [Streptomyces kaniharaensis]|uniref:GvpL/GvpF family gas vesicle protein n=1 Tax=Streptomyces kaniharaensis TaxID=212423 RepID=A0A6N7KY83_9ACTN|nr:GvpL/GvpF family gas vesicle protein [Streptomyces kaniharaensis]MQS16646.1 GvpL/GvpF family gas vesicle protein [Streptomyces kaniharaensis]
MSLYVYAITKASHPLHLDELRGVGDPPAKVYAVRGDSLCAVASEMPEDLAARRRDLEAHHGVQERLWADGATLPLSFGFVAQDEDMVRALLEERAEEFTQRMEELTDRVEFNVKATQDEEAMLREILEESDELRRLNEATREGGGSYEERVAFGQMVAEQVQSRQNVLEGEIVAALKPLARAERLSPPSSQYALNASYLVDRGKAEEFVEAGRKLAKRYQDQAELRVLGPLPPYSFV